MKRLPRDFMLGLLGLCAIAGVAAAGVSLYRALSAVRVLVSVGAFGTNALSSIQYEAQASQQAVLQVLAAENFAVRRARSAQARLTDGRIAAYFQELMVLDRSGTTGVKVDVLRDQWQTYTNLRERVISLALEGRLAEARALEAGPAIDAFERVSISLQAIQQSLAVFSAQEQETIRTGLKDAVAELCAMAATTILFVATLIWSRHKQRKLHYEIAAYGTVRALARQIGAIDAARLLSHTLGEEESSDFLLTAISDPLLQQAAIEDGGKNINLETVEKLGPARATRKTEKHEKMASRGR